MTHHCMFQRGHDSSASQPIVPAHDARDTAALRCRKSPGSTPLASLWHKRQKGRHENMRGLPPHPARPALYFGCCFQLNFSVCFIMLRCHQEEEQTEFSAVSLQRGSIQDFQSPLPCCLLPPAVSCHEFPVLKSIGGVVQRPKPQHYIIVMIPPKILPLLLLLQLLLQLH